MSVSYVWTGRWVWYADWDRSVRGLRPEELMTTTDAAVAAEKLAWPEFKGSDGSIIHVSPYANPKAYDRVALSQV